MPGNDLLLLTEAARQAGEIAKRFWRADPQVWDKPGGQGPVTEADLAVNEMLRSKLRSARPDYGWMSEEDEDDSSRRVSESVFIVDPIDGTRAFTEGEKTFSHSIAISRGGQIMAGVVYLPVLDLMFAAERGQGATLQGETIAVADRGDLTGADVLTTKPTMHSDMWRKMPDIKRSFRSSLAYRLCLVAQGRFDAMITLRDTWDWDIAAGSLIAEEAGARVTDRRGLPLRFNSSVHKSKGAIAASVDLHKALLAHLA